MWVRVGGGGGGLVVLLDVFVVEETSQGEIDVRRPKLTEATWSVSSRPFDRSLPFG